MRGLNYERTTVITTLYDESGVYGMGTVLRLYSTTPSLHVISSDLNC